MLEFIRKRDGRLAPFEPEKINEAIDEGRRIAEPITASQASSNGTSF